MFTPDDYWIRPRNRHLLIAGSPASLSRVTDAGVPILDALEQRRDPPPGHEPLTTRLVMSGSIHHEADGNVAPTDLTVVVPAYITSSMEMERLSDLVRALAPLHVVVVDDASPLHVELSTCEVVRMADNSGPAAARNLGASRVTTPMIAFVDSDATVDCARLVSLARHLRRGETDMAAPRVMSSASRGPLARYERMSSALDMGRRTTRVRNGGRVPYVPSTCFVTFTDAFVEMNGFDQALRYGEDVDYVWRAIRNGMGVKFVADVVVQHAARRSIRAFAAQRFSYGTSAGPLARRHGPLAAPYRGDALITASWVGLGLGWWMAALPLAVLACVLACGQLVRKGVDVSSALRVVSRSMMLAGRHLASAITKPWVPFIVVGALFNGRVAVVLLCAFVIPAAIDYGRRPTVDPVTYLVLRAIEHFSYGVGVLWGALRAHSPTAMLPSVTVRR